MVAWDRKCWSEKVMALCAYSDTMKTDNDDDDDDDITFVSNINK